MKNMAGMIPEFDFLNRPPVPVSPYKHTSPQRRMDISPLQANKMDISPVRARYWYTHSFIMYHLLLMVCLIIFRLPEQVARGVAQKKNGLAY